MGYMTEQATRLWGYEAMGYMTEQLTPTTKWHSSPFARIWKRYRFPLRINCRIISTNLFFSFPFFLSLYLNPPPKSGAIQDEMGKRRSLWTLSLLVLPIPALSLRHGAPIRRLGNSRQHTRSYIFIRLLCLKAGRKDRMSKQFKEDFAVTKAKAEADVAKSQTEDWQKCQWQMMSPIFDECEKRKMTKSTLLKKNPVLRSKKSLFARPRTKECDLLTQQKVTFVRSTSILW